MVLLFIIYATIHLCRKCYDYGYQFFSGTESIQNVENTEA